VESFETDLNSESPSHFLLPVAIALCGFLAVAYLTLFTSKPGEPVLVVFPPWTSQAEAVSASLTANATFIGVNSSTPVVSVAPLSNDYEARVKAAGAWFVISAFGPLGCDWLSSDAPRERQLTRTPPQSAGKPATAPTQG